MKTRNKYCLELGCRANVWIYEHRGNESMEKIIKERKKTPIG